MYTSTKFCTTLGTNQDHGKLLTIKALYKTY